MWQDIKSIYGDTAKFSRAYPLLFLVPVLVEMAQHVVELQAGMYFDEAGAKAAEADSLRLQFGFAKTLALLLPGYWFVRYILMPDRQRAVRFEMPAAALFAVVFAFSAMQLWWSLFGPGLVENTGLEGKAATAATVVQEIAAQVLSIYLTAWMVAWPLGNASIGPFRSFAVMHGSFWYALVLMLAAVIPLMLLHYGFAIAAVLILPPTLDWLAMVLDSVVVGYLALTLAGSAAYAAKRAAHRNNVDLLPVAITRAIS